MDLTPLPSLIFLLHRLIYLVSQERMGSPKFSNASLHACHALPTPAVLPESHLGDSFRVDFLSRYAVIVCSLPLTGLSKQASENTASPVAHMVLCVRFN